MMRLKLPLLLAACFAIPTVSQAAGIRQLLPSQPVTVRDLVEMTRFGSEHQLLTDADGRRAIELSPDRKKFAVVIRKGDIHSNTTRYSLLVFRLVGRLVDSRPINVASLSSSSNRPAISQVEWLRDSDSLTFLGERPGGTPQLYRTRIHDLKMVRLTDNPAGVVEYSMNLDGDAFVYAASAKLATGDAALPKTGFAITTQRLHDLYVTGWPPPEELKQLFVKSKGMKAPRPVGHPFYSCDSDHPGRRMTISDSGKFAMVCSFTLDPPASWDEYKPGFQTLSLTTKGTPQDPYSCPLQTLLVDLDAKSVGPLLNAPEVRASEGSALFVWTKRNTALLMNIFLPLDSSRGAEKLTRRESVYAAEVSVPERKIVEIARQQAPFHAYYLKVQARGDVFVTDPIVAAWGSPLVLRQDAAGWTMRTENKAHEGTPVVAFEQAMNERPKITETIDGRETEIFDPNRSFSSLQFGRVASFTWTMHRGDKMEGALYYPPKYVAGHKYPLVIQTHGYSRHQFSPDGPFTTAYAAQPLASRGFVVLQIPNANGYSDPQTVAKEAAVFGTATESTFDQDQIESAIEELDRQGLVDTNRIGLSGFSRTVYQVLYTLTHPHFHYAAAVVADGADFGYGHCIFDMSVENQQTLCELMNGGKVPFGEGLSAWEKSAPNFRLDKIEAPLLLQSILEPLGEWEIFSGLRWLKKPAEMIDFYPEGEHELVQPQQVFLSEESVVDWYSFWMTGYEDPDPAKREQYDRWRRLCDLQVAERKGQPTYCVPSTPTAH